MAVEPLKVQVEVTGKGELDALTTSAQHLEKEIKAAEGTTKVAGQGMARGLLPISYALDDIQYGFRAIVNNIPQIGMGLGQAMGMNAAQAMNFAGALGIVAVTANQIVNHWEELNRIFGNTAPVETIRGIAEELKKVVTNSKDANQDLKEVINLFSPALIAISENLKPYVSRWKEATQAAEEHQKTLDKIKEATEHIKGIKGKQAAEQGSELQEALSRAGGGEIVARKMFEEAIAKGGVKDKAMQDEIAKQIRLTLQRGLEGEDIAKALPEDARNKLADVKTEKRLKAQREQDNEKERLEAEAFKVAKDSFEHGKHRKLEGMEIQREELSDQRWQLQRAMEERRQEHNVVGDSALDFTKRVQQGALDQVPKQSLQQLKEIDKKLHNIDMNLSRERRAVFGQ